MRIGLIGIGTIGSFLAERIINGSSLELCFVLDIDSSKVKGFPKEIVVNSIDEIAAKKPQLVVEAASAEAVGQYAEAVLSRTNFLILSAAALADKALEEKIKNICKKHGTKLFIPSGAIAAIDMLKAVQQELQEVELISKKNPIGWGRNDKKETIIFEGNASEACRLYPKNVNISATIALNGIGFDRTKVKLISDPECKANQHILKARHSLGTFAVDVSAIPSKNPKTSSTAAYSTFDLIKKIQNGINIY